jgi:predicted PurR-regulated permease PerM
MEINNRSININITALTVLKIIGLFILFYFLYLIKSILAIFFISLILASAFDPWVDWMQKRKIPRGFGIIFIYLIMLVMIISIISLIIPPIVEQSTELARNFPEIYKKFTSGFSAFKQFSAQHGVEADISEYLNKFSANSQGTLGNVFSTVSGIINSIFTFFLVFVVTFYMTVEENAIKKIVWSIVPEKNQVYVMHLINRMQIKIGLWLRGQLILCFIIFVLTFIGLSILKVKYALILALIAGVTEFIPYLGPIFSSIPAIFLSATQSLWLGVSVAILYVAVQQTENHIIVPKLMQKVVGLNPIVSIAVLMIGFKIGGIIGAILAIPVATAITVGLKDIIDSKETEEAKGTEEKELR